MSAAETRYSRQTILPEIGQQGQRRLSDSRVLIIGMGGLGSPVAMYLAACGIGRLVLSDFDRVDETNLQRQIIHRTKDIGELKAQSALSSLQEINPDIEIIAIDWVLGEQELEQQIESADLVLDCCDNFATRFELNRLCYRHQTPLVSGAAIRWEGQVISFQHGKSDQEPCYQCLYSSELENTETCASEGIMAPVVGVIGCIQAQQALLILLDMADDLSGRLLIFDGKCMEWRQLTLSKDPECPVCG